MPKLHISIHVDQNGLQTINSDGDPSLWPLVSRLSAAAIPPILSLTENGQPQRPVVNISNVSSTPMSGLAHQIAEHAWFSELWSRTTERPLLVGETMNGRRFAVLDSDDSRLQSATEEQVDLIDAILRPVVAADDGDSCTDLAGLARGELVAVREELQATRAVLEEAIGRTPDPARSTKQLALDLAEVLKAAVAAR